MQALAELDEVAPHERLQQPVTQRLAHLEAGHQRGKQRGVAHADAVVLQADRVERVAEHRERLCGALRRGRADQLDTRLQQLAQLAALGAHSPIAVREIAEAQRRLARRVARSDDSRDRHGHVRAQHEHCARLVEHTVGRLRFGHVGTCEHGLVLERRRVDLAVAVAVEGGAQGVCDRAHLARLLWKHVARATGDRIDHGEPEEVTRARARSPRARSARRARADARRCARTRGRSGGCCRSRCAPPRTVPPAASPSPP